MLLNYLFLTSSEINNRLELNLNSSDIGIHETILNTLVGNLVKFSKNGKIEPYLAENYRVSDDGLIFDYKLRGNLFCDDGTPITAQSFVDALTTQLRIYTEKSNALDFELLEGFEEFKLKKKTNISGLSFNGDHIVFKFIKKPEDLNELLRMPYFGFWHSSNLNTVNSIKNRKFISSGAFSLSKNSSDEEIIVKKRSQWFSVNENTIDTIRFAYVNKENISANFIKNNNVIIETNTRLDLENTVFSNMLKIFGVPTSVTTLVLSPYKRPFSDQNVRRWFLEKIQNLQNDHDWSSKFFYINAKSHIEKNLTNTNQLSFPKKISMGHLFKSVNGMVLKTSKMIEDALIEYSVQVDLEGIKNENEKWLENFLSDKYFDIRLCSVANGSYPRNFIIKMMFCSKLGVSFPDVSGRICKLVERYESWSGPLPEEYINELNQIIYEDAAVIPLNHFGPLWLLSETIDKEKFQTGSKNPLFEKLSLNN